ncbi:TNF receptor-associated factor 6 [Protopterus annectens]|uniref:TNF receptor-associated factor 6 n=1 Tax=Protopterus annectens TaxID=7888 RepID=UPI001CFB798E|nr:TNF receptor-associated factor 6 [Protopterus annectens]XP_043938764.1 TNF receptor-associated factor 6 [Protopterus annectens]XP_043938765.1 TNF receptor-associated factor 6 [Protopterus annectens]XP_043938766.1 TNF receptor-associated factor 6 [Protopterus annectens]
MSLLQVSSSDSETGSFKNGTCAAMASACYAASKEDSVSGTGYQGGSFCHSSSLEETQGYDVEFDPPLESKYECPICLMALREAVQTPCGHRFCKGCILKSIRDAGPKCPIDNEILLENHLFPDNFAKREILSLTVKCPNKGCLQKMELRHLEEHQVHCKFATMECIHCQCFFLKNEEFEHQTQHCPRRKVSCENCALQMPYDETEIHNQTCPLASVICEYCSAELIREQIPSHYNVDCPRAPVPCIFSSFGCPEKMQRHELASHMQEFTQVHLRMMATFLQGLNLGSLPTMPSPMHALEPLRFEALTSGSSLPQSSLPQSSCDCSPTVYNLRETIQQLEGRLVRQDHQIRELIAKMETQNTLVAEHKKTIRTLEEKVAELEAQQCSGIYIWKIENFSMYMRLQENDQQVVLHSPGFYTGKPGYKLCLRLHLQLPGAQRSANYLSLFVHTMQGQYDGYLPWPIQGTIRLAIVDQSEGPAKQDFVEIMETKPDLLAFQRPTIPRNPKGFGYVTFMPLQALKHHTYVKDDTLIVRCEVLIRQDMNCLRREGFQPRSTDNV